MEYLTKKTLGFRSLLFLMVAGFLIAPPALSAQDASKNDQSETEQENRNRNKKQASSLIEKQVQFFLDQLNTGNPYLDDWSRRQLIELGDRAIPTLVNQLKTNETAPPKQYLICEILGEIRSDRPAAVKILAKKLQNMQSNPSVASSAAKALGMIGVQQKDIIENLQNALEVGDTELTYNAIWALGTLRATSAADAVAERLDDTRVTFFDLRVENAAIEALGKLIRPGDEELIRKLKGKLDKRKEEPITGLPTAFYAVRALEQIYVDEAPKGPVMVEDGISDRTINNWKSFLDNELSSNSGKDEG